MTLCDIEGCSNVTGSFALLPKISIILNQDTDESLALMLHDLLKIFNCVKPCSLLSLIVIAMHNGIITKKL